MNGVYNMLYGMYVWRTNVRKIRRVNAFLLLFCPLSLCLQSPARAYDRFFENSVFDPLPSRAARKDPAFAYPPSPSRFPFVRLSVMDIVCGAAEK